MRLLHVDGFLCCSTEDNKGPRREGHAVRQRGRDTSNAFFSLRVVRREASRRACSTKYSSSILPSLLEGRGAGPFRGLRDNLTGSDDNFHVPSNGSKWLHSICLVLAAFPHTIYLRGPLPRALTPILRLDWVPFDEMIDDGLELLSSLPFSRVLGRWVRIDRTYCSIKPSPCSTVPPQTSLLRMLLRWGVVAKKMPSHKPPAFLPLLCSTCSTRIFGTSSIQRGPNLGLAQQAR
jgi:hypothetical protein